MPALNFKSRFVELVKTGTKRQTIRATRKNPIKVGDTLYLYTGMRTKNCEKLGQVACVSVSDIEITDIEILLNGEHLTYWEFNKLAIADGFDNAQEFLSFFPPMFKGQLIKW